MKRSFSNRNFSKNFSSKEVLWEKNSLEKSSFVKMSIDQVNVEAIDTTYVDNIVVYKNSIDDQIDIQNGSNTIYKNVSESDQKYFLTVFHTDQGYRGGYIINQTNKNYEVFFTRDEFGGLIQEFSTIPINHRIFPKRKNLGLVWIKTDPDIKATGYIKTRQNIDIGHGIGSGINSTIENNKRKLAKYPIYQPLTFHNPHHRNTLTYASSFILELIDEYLKNGKISPEILEQARWLVNVVLIIDDYKLIPENAFLEALSNFCLDYLMLAPETLIRQPINYIFDILGIDGVYSKRHLSISYIPTYFDGITYE